MSERPQFDDPEIEAMATVIEALEPFDDTIRNRILWYMKERSRGKAQVPTTPPRSETSG